MLFLEDVEGLLKNPIISNSIFILIVVWIILGMIFKIPAPVLSTDIKKLETNIAHQKESLLNEIEKLESNVTQQKDTVLNSISNFEEKIKRQKELIFSEISKLETKQTLNHIEILEVLITNINERIEYLEGVIIFIDILSLPGAIETPKVLEHFVEISQIRNKRKLLSDRKEKFQNNIERCRDLLDERLKNAK